MFDDKDTDLRDTALHLACGDKTPSGPFPPADVVARARAYYDFLKGDQEKTEADNG